MSLKARSKEALEETVGTFQLVFHMVATIALTYLTFRFVKFCLSFTELPGRSGIAGFLAFFTFWQLLANRARHGPRLAFFWTAPWICAVLAGLLTYDHLPLPEPLRPHRFWVAIGGAVVGLAVGVGLAAFVQPSWNWRQPGGTVPVARGAVRKQ